MFCFLSFPAISQLLGLLRRLIVRDDERGSGERTEGQGRADRGYLECLQEKPPFEIKNVDQPPALNELTEYPNAASASFTCSLVSVTPSATVTCATFFS